MLHHGKTVLPPEVKRRIERFQGALAGLALGDAVGAPVDGWTRSVLRGRLGRVDGPGSRDERGFLLGRVARGENPRKVAKSAGMVSPPGLYTHGAQQALLVAECFLLEGDVGGRRFADASARFAKPSKRGKFGRHRKPSPLFRASIGRVLHGEPWDTAGEEAAFGDVLPRALPLGLVFRDHPAALAARAAELALVTNRTASAVMPAVATAQLIARLSRKEPPLEARDVLDSLAKDLQQAEKDVVEAVGEKLLSPPEDLARFRNVVPILSKHVELASASDADRTTLDLLQKDLARALPFADRRITAGYAFGLFAAAAYIVLTESRGPKEAILRAVNLGRKTSLAGGLAGGLAGSLWGVHALPGSWLETLWNRRTLLALGESLARHGDGKRWTRSLFEAEADANRRCREARESLRREILAARR